MKEVRWWRWAGLVLVGVLAAALSSFNAGERVALGLGFVVIYRVPLIPLIFGAFLAGMATMFLFGLRHDLRVRQALREAGFGEPVSAAEERSHWPDDPNARELRPAGPQPPSASEPGEVLSAFGQEPSGSTPPPGPEPPPQFPP